VALRISVALTDDHFQKLITADATTRQLCSWVEDPRKTTCHRDVKISARVRRVRCTAQDFHHRFAVCESGVAGWESKNVRAAAGAEVAEDADDLVSCVALAHGDCRTVGVDGVCFVEYISAIFVDCLVSDLVQ
jgi:hypothetical protein